MGKGPSVIITLIIERLQDEVAVTRAASGRILLYDALWYQEKNSGTLVWAAWWGKNKYSAIGCGWVFQKRVDLVRIMLLPGRSTAAAMR